MRCRASADLGATHMPCLAEERDDGLVVIGHVALAVSDMHALAWAVPAVAGAAVIWTIGTAGGPLLVPATVVLLVTLVVAVAGMLVRLRRPAAPPSRSRTG